MIDAIYILRENGLRFMSQDFNHSDGASADNFADLVTGFFAALENFSDTTFNEHIEHVHFKNGRRLYFKDFKLTGNIMIKLVMLTSLGTDPRTIKKLIDGKSIKLKWVLDKLVDYIRINQEPPLNVKEDMKEKIIQIFQE